MTIFSEKVYDFIKYVCVIGIPAVSTFILGLGQVFDWTWCEPCSIVLILVQTLLGALFCVDCVGYSKSELAATQAVADEDEDTEEENDE